MYNVKVIIVCYNSQSRPDVVSVDVTTNEVPQLSNKHWIAAKKWAKNNGWEGPMIVFDETSPEFNLFNVGELDWSEKINVNDFS